MYAIYAYIGVVLGVNLGIYGIHGVSGVGNITRSPGRSSQFDLEEPFTRAVPATVQSPGAHVLQAIPATVQT